MGQGNYLPPTDEVYPHIYEDALVRCDPVYEMVYVEASQDDDFIHELIASIRRLLPDSFYQPRSSREWENQVLKVVLKGEYHTYHPLFVTPFNPLGIGHIDRLAARLFGGLMDQGYRLSVRCGAWTSGPYTKPALLSQRVSNAGK